jgi:hypothetical protein
MNYYFIIITSFFIQFISCTSIGQLNSQTKQGIIQPKAHFYDANGRPTFIDSFKIWYKDSIVIQEIHRTDSVITGQGNVSVTFSPILWRYIDLRSKTLYDYKSFSDTARMINKASLPDSGMRDYGWSFYLDDATQIQGVPEPMSDTAIDGVMYKRVKFNFAWHNPQTNYAIGYLRCDGKGLLFSLEKSCAKKANCTTVKIFDFKGRKSKPWSSQEVDFISDSLTKDELKVFETWERNARQNPVSN